MTNKIISNIKKIFSTKKPILLLYFLFYMPWFILLEKFVTKYQIVHVPLDNVIPFNEVFIIPYIVWFLYVAITVIYFLINTNKEYIVFSLYLYIGMTIFLIMSTISPTGHLLRPTDFARNNIFVYLVKILYYIDTPTNILPSIHVYNSVACFVAIYKNKKLSENKSIVISSFILTVLIILSTVFLKQHSVVDVITGIMLAYIFYIIFYVKKPKFIVKFINILYTKLLGDNAV